MSLNPGVTCHPPTMATEGTIMLESFRANPLHQLSHIFIRSAGGMLRRPGCISSPRSP
jgi:hypothetical protein